MSGQGKIIAIVKCENCGKDVEIRHRNRLNSKHICCSKKCMSEYIKKNNPNYIPCKICGELFYVKPSKQNGMNCCSYKCLGELRKSLFLGVNNPNFGNKGSLNPIWKSDEKISHNGYRQIRCIDHPFKNSDDFVFEHRLVAEKYLLNEQNSILIDGNRYLSNNFDVHHIDFNRLNNDPINLCVMPKGLHVAFHNTLYEAQRDENGRFISHELIVDITNSDLMKKMLIDFIDNNQANNEVALSR